MLYGKMTDIRLNYIDYFHIYLISTVYPWTYFELADDIFACAGFSLFITFNLFYEMWYVENCSITGHYNLIINDVYVVSYTELKTLVKILKFFCLVLRKLGIFGEFSTQICWNSAKGEPGKTGFLHFITKCKMWVEGLIRRFLPWNRFQKQ